ncbi:unnamed protein product [Camellia sinensis]
MKLRDDHHHHLFTMKMGMGKPTELCGGLIVRRELVILLLVVAAVAAVGSSGNIAEEKAAETGRKAKEASESWAEWTKEKITEGLGFKAVEEAKDVTDTDIDTDTATATATAMHTKDEISGAGQNSADKSGEMKNEDATEKAAYAKETAFPKAEEAKHRAYETAEEAKEKSSNKIGGETKDKEAYHNAEEAKERASRKAKEKANEEFETAKTKAEETLEVFKGRKMPGRMGGKQRIVKDVWVYKIDPARNLMWVRGQTVAGLAADGRQVVARAKFEATNYERCSTSSWLEEKLTNIESENKVLCQQAVSMAPNKILSGRSKSILQVVRVVICLWIQRQLWDLSEVEDKPQKSLNEKQQENQELLIRCIGQHLGFAGNRPIAACIIYKCLLQWRSFEVERTSVFDRIIQTIGHAIERTLKASGAAGMAPQHQKDGEVSRVLHLYTAERLSSFGELALMV